MATSFEELDRACLESDEQLRVTLDALAVERKAAALEPGEEPSPDSSLSLGIKALIQAQSNHGAAHAAMRRYLHQQVVTKPDRPRSIPPA